jgi:hypothetical protein
MKHARSLFTLLSTLALAACSEQGGDVAPPGCRNTSSGALRCEAPYPGADFCCDTDGTGEPYTCWSSPTATPAICDGPPFNPGADTDGPATSTTSGGGSTTGEPWCTANCPEEADGVCPGHAEWDRGIMIWGLWRPNDENGNPDPSSPASVTHQDPVCAPSLGVCVSYMHPDDIPALEGDMAMEQLLACQSLTDPELAALDLDDTSIGQNGWSLIGHFCVAGTQLDVDFQGQNFVATATATQSTCLGDGSWGYEGYCSATDCPAPEGAGSTGAEAEVDCAPLKSSNVSVDLSSNPREVTFRGAAAEMLIDDTYGTLYACSEALINSNGVIWDLPRETFLTNLGLVEDDQIISVDGSSKNMMSAVANAFMAQREFSVAVKRGERTINYTVEVIDPNP